MNTSPSTARCCGLGPRRPPSFAKTAAQTGTAAISVARNAATTPTPRPPIPDARLYKKRQESEAHLAYLDHALTENRHGFAVTATVTHATGTAEREAALTLLDAPRPADDTGPPAALRRTLGADKNYDTGNFVAQCRARNITPHVAQNDRRVGGSAIDERTTRHAGYAVSRVKRQMAERVHAWPKTWSTMRRAMVRGLDRIKAHYQMAITGGKLMRLVNLTG